jgi:hypothetical protein
MLPSAGCSLLSTLQRHVASSTKWCVWGMRASWHSSCKEGWEVITGAMVVRGQEQQGQWVRVHAAWRNASRDDIRGAQIATE